MEKIEECKHAPTQGAGSTVYCMKCGVEFPIDWDKVEKEYSEEYPNGS
jgi:hypothetical protein